MRIVSLRKEEKKNTWQPSTAICSQFIVCAIIILKAIESVCVCVCVFDINIIRDHHKLLLPPWLQLYYCTPHLFFRRCQVENPNDRMCLVTDEVKYVKSIVQTSRLASTLVSGGTMLESFRQEKTKTELCLVVLRGINTEQKHKY